MRAPSPRPPATPPLWTFWVGNTLLLAASVAAWGVLKSTMKLPVGGPARACARARPGFRV